jgi:choline dehydrogenase-like flavoprotein
MIATGQDAPALIKADVCVVGSGPAGMTVALELERLGVDCVLLESGLRTPSPEHAALNDTPQVGITTDPPIANRVRALGGTSWLWGGYCRRLDAIDFEARAWVPDSGWPITLGDLLPYYDVAHRLLGLPPARYELAEMDGGAGSEAPLDGPSFENVVYYYNGRPKRFGTEHASTLEASRRISTYLDSTVVDVETDASGRRVAAVHVRTLAGKRFRVEPQRLVLATGVINTARLLLNANRTHRAGLGNEHDLVGRYFAQHPVWDKPRMLLLDAAHTQRMRRSHAGEISILTALRARAQQAHGLLNCCLLTKAPRPPPGFGDKRELLRYWAKRALRTFDELKGDAQVERYLLELHAALDAAGRRKPRLMELEVRPEQVPNRESRITLGDARDRTGMRRAVMDWRLTELDRESVRKTLRLLACDAGLLDIGRVHADPARLAIPEAGGKFLHGGNHQFGTARMSDSPRRGVVDRDCRMHGVANLYIAGSATFPTTGSANPTLSIVAMAARVAAHVARTGAAPQLVTGPSE